jgi:hypothetical protein
MCGRARLSSDVSEIKLVFSASEKLEPVTNTVSRTRVIFTV